MSKKESEPSQGGLTASLAGIDTVFEHASLPMFVTDRMGRYQFVNGAYRALLGVSGSDLVGQAHGDGQPETVATRLRETDQQVLETGTPLEFDQQLQIDGGSPTLHFSKAPIFLEG